MPRAQSWALNPGSFLFSTYTSSGLLTLNSIFISLGAHAYISSLDLSSELQVHICICLFNVSIKMSAGISDYIELTLSS